MLCPLASIASTIHWEETVSFSPHTTTHHYPVSYKTNRGDAFLIVEVHREELVMESPGVHRLLDVLKQQDAKNMKLSTCPR